MGRLLGRRRVDTTKRLDRLRAELKPAERLASRKACVYLTGSFGRGEASRYSDLDLFIVGKVEKGQRALRRLDEICLQADLIRAARKLRFPEFSRDGMYLDHSTIEALVGTLGTPEDDATNTFTARLLLLLESRPLIGSALYSDLIDQVVEKYWLEFRDHRGDFVPAFLANDILRLWRTFCVNYEAGTQREPAEKKAKRKIKN